MRVISMNGGFAAGNQKLETGNQKELRPRLILIPGSDFWLLDSDFWLLAAKLPLASLATTYSPVP